MNPDLFIADLPPLKPGDHLLYWTRDLVDYAISLKTWSEVAHIEVYVGDPHAPGERMAVASRATGVNLFDFRREGLRFVLRPHTWDEAGAWTYFRTVRGQKYDWLGLFCFTLAVKQGAAHKQFCSEFARNLDRAAGLDSFAVNWPGDKTAPGSFLMSPSFDLIYDSNLDYEVPDGEEDWRVAP
jgi:hypothetical protein